MTGTVTTISQIKNLIGRVRKNNRAARATPTFEQVRAVLRPEKGHLKINTWACATVTILRLFRLVRILQC